MSSWLDGNDHNAIRRAFRSVDLAQYRIPEVPRCTGNGCYEVGDRVVALDLMLDENRAGTIGSITAHDSGKRRAIYIVVVVDPETEEYFLCEPAAIIDVLPDPDDPEAVEAWLGDGHGLGWS